MATYRTGVLKCYDLTTADFPSVEEAYACADQYIAKQRADWPEGLLQQYPDQLFGCPAGDLFFFSDYKGMGPQCLSMYHCAFLHAMQMRIHI